MQSNLHLFFKKKQTTFLKHYSILVLDACFRYEYEAYLVSFKKKQCLNLNNSLLRLSPDQ